MAGEQILIPPRKRTAKTLSLRDLLNDMAAYRRAVDRGEISSADGQRRCAMVQSHAEVLLTAKMLELQGGDTAVEITPTEGYAPPEIAPHRVKKVTAKVGTGRHGERIDEKSVSIQSTSADDDGLEVAAEIEALA